MIRSPLFILGLLICLISTKYYPIFPDERVGKGNKPIKVFKFRTMYKDAETNIRNYFNKKQIKQWEIERKECIFIGRLGEYKYYDMDDVILSALEFAKEELN